MKILIIHNHYLEQGGEDEVVKAEAKLLEDHGHRVILYEKSNEEIKGLPFLKKIIFFLSEINFSMAVYKEIKEITKKERPDIAHVHNIFIRITPSVYSALKEENVPIVQSLHNYRFFCLRGTLFNNGEICEKCKDNQFFNAVSGRCWRDSFILSFLLAKLFSNNNSFLNNIDSYIALSKFSRDKFIEFGLAKEKIYLKGNFTNAEPNGNNEDHNYALFIGRLVDYKGIETLMEAFKRQPYLNLKIIGDGPLRKKVQNVASSYKNIEFLGKQERISVFETIKNSSFIVFPSECYENMPMVMMESFAFSKPVLASDLGAIREFVIDGVSGLLFETGNAEDLSKKASYLFSHKKEQIEMGENANKIYNEMFEQEKNYTDLITIYTETINAKEKRDRHA